MREMRTFRELSVGDTVSILGRPNTITGLPVWRPSGSGYDIGDFAVAAPDGARITLVARADALVGAL